MESALYVVATPIGNLGDITLRAIDILKQVDLIACEDSRQTLKLLNYLGISKPLLSVFGPKEQREASKIVRLLQEGKSIALVSDAGTPAVSDPGQELVNAVVQAGLKVVPVPGVSALATIMSISANAANGCVFLGFLRRDKGKIKKELRLAAEQERLVIFYESPHRTISTLKIILELFGPETFVCLGREMTKKFETYLHGTVEQILSKIENSKVLGEVTIAIRVNK